MRGAANPRPAATVVVLRPGPTGPEVLLTRRPATMAFAPGLHVFPGGAVDAGDHDPRVLARSARSPDACAAALLGELPPATAAAHHVAAIRELFEEAGVLLASRAGDGVPGGGGDERAAIERSRADGLPFADLVEAEDLVLRTDALVPLSRWVTPPVMARRFDTRFFAAALPPGSVASAFGDEVTGLQWLTPGAALAAAASGRIEVWMPTSVTLLQLAWARDLDDVRAHLCPTRAAPPPLVQRISPTVTRIRLGEAGGIPGQEVNAWLVGRRRMVLVDPGDPNDAAADAILGAAAGSGATIEGIVVTAPVPDHVAGAHGLALRLGVDVLAAPGAAGLVAHAIRPLSHGDAVGLGDARMVAHATAGTHPDHVALELPGTGIVLAGDLAGEPASRAIPGPVDPVALAASRAEVARLGARLLLPAHGDPVPGSVGSPQA